MVKISDIFKQGNVSPEKEPKGKPAQAPEQKIPIREIQKEGSAPAKPPESISIKEVGAGSLKRQELLSNEETEKLYQDSISLIKSILDKGLKKEAFETQEIKNCIEKIVDQIYAGNTVLINLTNNSTPENYLFAHSINVAILSLVLGLGLGYNKEQLIELGVASFLHDIGMVKVTEITQKTGKITEEEYNKIKGHPVYGVDILSMVKDISQAAIYVAQEHHEWPNGKGYPKGLKGSQIEEYARIVSTVDTYEALTHPRPYREKLHPYEAVRDILKNKEHFDFKFLKVLIERIGIFPIGSWVMLSTNEIGQVIDVNKDSPLKPTVKIMFDAQENRIYEEKIINLIQYPTLYIKKPIDELKLPSKK